jgi:hypothetical protein
MSTASQMMEGHVACAARLLEFLERDEAGLLARIRELEAELDAAGLGTAEAIRAAWERLDAGARKSALPQAPSQHQPGARLTSRLSPRRFGNML